MGAPTAGPNVATSQSSFDPLTTVILPGALLLTAIAAFTFMPIIQSTRVLQWLQRMRYRYEVTFVLYMLSPMEKFVLSMYHKIQVVVRLLIVLRRLHCLPFAILGLDCGVALSA